MSVVQNLLDRLDKVKSTGKDKWQACCPAHGDRSPSLSIKEAEDGTVLIKCWAGCEFADIVGAVGLSPSDLFPDSLHEKHGLSKKNPWIPRDALAGLANEATIVELVATEIGDGQIPKREDILRCRKAAKLIRDALSLV